MAKFLNYDVSCPLRLPFNLADSADLDEMLPYLGLHCLTKYMFTGTQNENCFII